MAKKNQFYLELNEMPLFDFNRLQAEPPETFKTAKGSSCNQTLYVVSEGKKCEFIVEVPPQIIFGVSYKGTYDPTGKNITEIVDVKNAVGAKIGYPLTSMDTVKNPTDKEKIFKEFLDQLAQCVKNLAIKEAKMKKLAIPASSSLMIKSGDESSNFGIKPLSSLPYKKKDGNYILVDGEKVRDDSKPETMYVDLMIRGKGESMIPITPFYEGKEKKNAFHFLNVRGMITPIFLIEKLYYGTHGDNPHGCSIKIFLYEANFKPQALGHVEGPRRLKVEDSDETPAKPSSRALERLGKISSVEDKMASVTVEDDDDESPQITAKIPPKKIKKIKKKAPPPVSEDSD